MSKLEYLIAHCTATPAGRDIKKEDIIRWHTSPVSEGGRGWRSLGYSDMIYLDGSLINLTPFNQDDIVDPWEITNGAKGLNGKSRHFVYAGGLDIHPELCHMENLDELEFNEKYAPADTRTPAQLDTMDIYIKYMVKRHPHILVGGHNQVSSKPCPSFNMTKYLRSIGVEEKNILVTR